MKYKDDLKAWSEILQKTEKVNEMQPVTALTINLTTKEFRKILETFDQLLEERQLLAEALSWIYANTDEDGAYKTSRETLGKIGEIS
jgi:hypothetical protein